ncbi:sporulation integral membrane protein YlbJ [Paenibacillus ginsengarvi]|uniref:Sporulation integral membrane protein YlbJ n=1 Tax=Paenibacillus ginsengarvi TaxID=400777 RepID=A0A3B0AYC7_9BACL|nr:sporulation integral membrane protein YlbJ [Paenibacillus ginsengarvi]RKN65443.1 sporulation integral membrane protein YlbJ [Paenibacillus ginsengarvi]
MTASRVWSTALFSASLLGVAALMLLYPAQSLEAALRGLSIWWDILFPALVPFLVIAELMLGFGIVHFFGTLLDPMMRPLFRVPGIGGFAMAMGFASGYPVGARLTAQLWEQRLLGRDEGERLVSFTTTSDPIFLIGAVSVGFFHNVGLAVILAAAHYGTGVVIGLLMRFHGSRTMTVAVPQQGDASLLRRAMQAMHRARLRDSRTFGEMLQEALQTSLKLMMVIGGLVVFFCVVLEVLTISQVMNGLYATVTFVLQGLHVPPELSQAVVNGLFEVTLGAKSAAGAGAHLSLASKVAVAAFILSWGGLSVHAQVISLLSRTNIRYVPFGLARLVHGFLAAAAVFVLWKPLAPAISAVSAAVPAFSVERGLLPVWPALFSLSGLLFIGTLVLFFLLYAAYLGLRPLLHYGRR